VGLGLRIMPGVRLSVSSRGVRAGIGPRPARVHVGSGGVGFSTGAGPLTYYTGTGARSRSSGRTTMAAAERQARQAARAQEIEQVRAADLALQEQMRAHQQEFGPLQPPAAAPSEPVDLSPLTKQFEREALHGVSRFDRAGRKEARATAMDRARQEAAVETQRQAAAAAEKQSQLTEGWQRLLANDAQAVFHQLEAAFEDNQAPSAPIDCDGDRVIVAMFLPPVDDLVPPRKVATTPAGTPTIHKRNKTEQNGLYAMVLASNVVATAKEVFAVAPGVRYEAHQPACADRRDARAGPRKGDAADRVRPHLHQPRRRNRPNTHGQAPSPDRRQAREWNADNPGGADRARATALPRHGRGTPASDARCNRSK